MMNSTLQRQILLPLIEQAIADGARAQQACAQIGMSVRTLQRWAHPSVVLHSVWNLSACWHE